MDQSRSAGRQLGDPVLFPLDSFALCLRLGSRRSRSTRSSSLRSCRLKSASPATISPAQISAIPVSSLTGILECEYAKASIQFTWEGADEMDEASGDGWAELQDNGSLKGEISFHHGEESDFSP
jgi:hypothetical protein